MGIPTGVVGTCFCGENLGGGQQPINRRQFQSLSFVIMYNNKKDGAIFGFHITFCVITQYL